MIAGLLGLLLQAPGSADWESLQVRLEAGPASHWRERVASVARELSPDAVPVALDCLESWPPTPALHLRSCLSRGRFRTALLREVLDGSLVHSRLARLLLAEQLDARLREAELWTGGVRAHRDRALALQPDGLRLELLVPEGTSMPLLEFLELLREAEVLSAPLVLWPGLLQESDAGLEESLPLQPAEWGLRRLLHRRGFVALRLLFATWVVPAKLARRFQEELPARERERQQVLFERERWLFHKALVALRQHAGEAGNLLVAAKLLADLGLLLPADPGHGASGSLEQAALLVAAAYELQPLAEPVAFADVPRPWWPLLRRALSFSRARQSGPAWQALAGETFSCGELSGSHRQALLEWLEEDSDSPLPVRHLSALEELAAQRPEAVLRRLAEGRVPYALVDRVTVDGVMLEALEESGDLTSCDGGVRRAALVARHARAAAGSPRDPPAILVSQLVRGQAVDFSALRPWLEKNDATGRALREVLAVELSSAAIRHLLEGALAEFEADAKEIGETGKAARWRERLGWMVDLIVARGEQDSLLAGRCRQVVIERSRGIEDEEARHLLQDLADQLWELGGLLVRPPWLLALADRGWLELH